jgi:hypothetical protein
VLLLGGGCACGSWIASSLRAAWGRAADAERIAEARQLLAQGAIVEQQLAQQALARAVEDSHGLERQLHRLRRQLEGRPKFRELTRWRTQEIEVPVDRLVPGATVAVPCPAGEALAFDIRGAEARIETRAGNTVLVGQAQLWRVRPPPEEQLGSAEFLADASELVVARERARARRWRLTPYLGLSSEPAAVLGAVWQRRGQFGWWVQASRGVPLADNHVGGTTLAGGVALSLGRP